MTPRSLHLYTIRPGFRVSYGASLPFSKAIRDHRSRDIPGLLEANRALLAQRISPDLTRSLATLPAKVGGDRRVVGKVVRALRHVPTMDGEHSNGQRTEAQHE